MSMKTFKIVDADQLDTNLNNIAFALKNKLNSFEPLSFPDDFIDAIASLYYHENLNTENDIDFEGRSVKIKAGYFAKDVTIEIPSNFVDVTNITQTKDNNTIIAPMAEGITDFTIPAGYYPEELTVEFLV